jgi:transposase
MKFVGVDLHKKTISACVVGLVNGVSKVLQRKRLCCLDTESIREYFAGLGSCRVAVEATASYFWFARLIEPLVERVVLVHPKKLRIIAESTRKTDKIDAQVLAEFLAKDMLPTAYRPPLRVRQHRVLVRQRHYLQRRITGVKNKMRHVLANYNADAPHIFTADGQLYVDRLELQSADRFVVEQLRTELREHRARLKASTMALADFAGQAPLAEQEARQILKSMPLVGPVTIDVVLAELGEWGRFKSQNEVVAYAGLAPGIRESAGHAKELGITKEGSKLLRWAMIQLAWRLVLKSPQWKTIYSGLQLRRGKKKAVVAVARRALCVLFALLRTGQPYRLTAAAK